MINKDKFSPGAAQQLYNFINLKHLSIKTVLYDLLFCIPVNSHGHVEMLTIAVDRDKVEHIEGN